MGWTVIRLCFNPRSRMGSDTPLISTPTEGKVFQSTLPHGERPTILRKYRRGVSFNPRSRMGSDTEQTESEAALQVSIHAPAWGATFI